MLKPVYQYLILSMPNLAPRYLGCRLGENLSFRLMNNATRTFSKALKHGALYCWQAPEISFCLGEIIFFVLLLLECYLIYFLKVYTFFNIIWNVRIEMHSCLCCGSVDLLWLTVATFYIILRLFFVTRYMSFSEVIFFQQEYK